MTTDTQPVTIQIPLGARVKVTWENGIVDELHFMGTDAHGTIFKDAKGVRVQIDRVFQSFDVMP